MKSFLRTVSMCLILAALIFAGCETETEIEKTDPAADETASISEKPDSAPSAGYAFEEPVRIKAGDEFISVDSPGYACPTMADVDGDGLEDLVVGQFKKGYMRFCRNIASSSEPPKFAKAEWIMNGDDKAEVPGVW